jgi:hypothetical protein
MASNNLAVRLMPEIVRSVAFGTIGAAYTGIGTAMTRPIRIFLLQNLTDKLLLFSFNGIDDHLPLPTNGYVLLDISANQSFNQGYYLAESSRLYVKQDTAAPTAGAVYLTTFYGGV